MKFNSYILLFLLIVNLVFSQTNTSRKYFSHPKQTTVNFSNINQDFNPTLLVREMPKPALKK